MTTGEYWNSLEFVYLTTYSFNRGIELEEYQTQVRAELEGCKEQLKIARYMERMKLEKQLAKLEAAQWASNARLIDTIGNVHPTAKAMKTIKKSDQETNLLEQILITPVKEHILSYCIPTFRDAIVFFDKDSVIISVLNVCLQCIALETSNKKNLVADFSVYEKLRLFFLQVGHPVESKDMK